MVQAAERFCRAGENAAKVARLHEKVANQRADFLDKTSRWLVDTYGLIGIEDLNVRGMVQNRRLAKRISDAGWGELRRQLVYKAGWKGSRIIVMDPFFPSSKICSCCGLILEKLDLATREWICPSCGGRHDRDHNAARKIIKQAITRAGIAQSNAGGEAVIPALSWLASLNPEATRFSGW